MQIYLPRFYVRELKSNLDVFRQDVDDAASQGANMALFPEQFLTGYHEPADPLELRAVFAKASAEHPKLLLACGTISEDNFNKQLCYLRGDEVAVYRKVHLFLPNREDELWQRGDSYAAYEFGEWRIGLITCNDVRFPEQVSALRLKYNINLLICPALWPWERDHIWSTLLRARAIENGIFVAGCCVAGVDNGSQLFDGAGNHVFDPLGTELHPNSRVYQLDRARLNDVLVNPNAQTFPITDSRLFT